MKNLEIHDEPWEDLLLGLKELCDWIEKGLKETREEWFGSGEAKQVGVLVHCTQGISRSGAVIVGFCQSSFSIPPLFYNLLIDISICS